MRQARMQPRCQFHVRTRMQGYAAPRALCLRNAGLHLFHKGFAPRSLTQAGVSSAHAGQRLRLFLVLLYHGRSRLCGPHLDWEHLFIDCRVVHFCLLFPCSIQGALPTCLNSEPCHSRYREGRHRVCGASNGLLDLINALNNSISGIYYLSTGSISAGPACTANGFIGQLSVQVQTLTFPIYVH
jgi:hypothetical protein